MTINLTRILCTDSPTHARHEVRLLPDGRFECGCGPAAVEEGKKMGAAILLGAPNVERRSCAGLIAFLAVGIPSLVAKNVDKTGAWGGWKDSWVSYQTNGLAREVLTRCVHERDLEHVETLKAARKALSSCARYRDGMEREDFASELGFLPESDEATPGRSVALFSSDSWLVPLQKDWLESVGKAKPVIDGRFIVGHSEHAGFCLAIDGSNDEGFTIEEFAIVNGKLGKVKAA
jgi:hypothetical protein